MIMITIIMIILMIAYYAYDYYACDYNYHAYPSAYAYAYASCVDAYHACSYRSSSQLFGGNATLFGHGIAVALATLCHSALCQNTVACLF
jgi:hypothetical protein